MDVDFKKIDEYNQEITNMKYFNLDDAIKCKILSRTAFIIANERLTNKKTIGRYFTVFPSFTDFLLNRHMYPHCHELFVDHKKSKVNKGGRLVFDFDIKDVIVPENFKDMIEKTVESVIDNHFHDVDKTKFIYIWSTSLNPKKFSKHLTVKNLYFDDWMQMSKIFYKLFYNEWKESKYDWIHPDKLVDFQIVRNRGSLRMVYSSKIDGNQLVLDNKNHHFVDSLIRIYFKNHRDIEQTISFNNLSDDIIDEQTQFELNQEYYTTKFFVSSKTFKQKSKPSFEKVLYQNAFKLLCEIMNNKQNKQNIFEAGEINGGMMRVIRLCPAKCLLSGKCHESENAFLLITFDGFEHIVRYGCFRYCSKIKTKQLGTVTSDSYRINYNSDKSDKSIEFMSDSDNSDNSNDSNDSNDSDNNAYHTQYDPVLFADGITLNDIIDNKSYNTNCDDYDDINYQYMMEIDEIESKVKKSTTKISKSIKKKILNDFDIRLVKKKNNRKNKSREKLAQKLMDKFDNEDNDFDKIYN